MLKNVIYVIINMTSFVKGRIVMTKVSLFFGAGAECSYGLPSGGKFALDIFRMNTSDDKINLKEQLNNVDKQSNYARWLPDGFDNKKLTAFTKTQYFRLLK